MTGEYKITGTRNIILLDAFNAINDIINRIIKNINYISCFHSAGNTRLWCHGGGFDNRCDYNGVHSSFGMRFGGMTRRI